MILIKNNSGRRITIQFSSDPDIEIKEQFEKEIIPLVAIEIKGEEDISNIHYRFGEAEKSHQKAKLQGHSQFWTLVRVNIDYCTLREEFPTTKKFYQMDKIQNSSISEYLAFRNNLSSLLSVNLD